MRTSRIANQTSRIVKATLKTSPASLRRQNRSFATTLKKYSAADDTTPLPDEDAKDGTETGETLNLKTENSQATVAEIEDVTTPIGPSLKRKRSVSTQITKTSSKETPSPQVNTQNGEIFAWKAPARKRRPARKVTAPNGEVEIHPPLHWEEVYDTVKEIRANLVAPVDTMGCETLAEDNISDKVHRYNVSTPHTESMTANKSPQQDRRFQTLIALMLSSQTRDTTTAAVMRALQTRLPRPGLTLANILALPGPALDELIRPAGFHNTKTKNIKATAELLAGRHGGDIPDTLAGLLALPGVGPKMAHLCLSAAWGRTEGVGVDVHVHRITNRWGWHRTGTPEQTRAALEAWLPRDRWHPINRLLVGFGQTLCRPVRPDCGHCAVGAKGLCPSIDRGSGRRKKTEADGLGDAPLRANAVPLDAVTAEQSINIKDMEDIGLGRRSLRPRN